MARGFAVRFVVENDEPVGRPMWVATGVRMHNYGSYVGPRYRVTDSPDQAARFAQRETAQQWADRLSFIVSDRVIYRYEVEEMDA